MPTLLLRGKRYRCRESETVLDCLTRHDVSIPTSCRSGICQCCLMKALKGTPPAHAQKGLKETMRAQNYFMACVCIPEGDLEMALAGTDITHRTTARIVGKEYLSRDVMRFRLECDRSFDYRPGQFLNLYRADGLVRSYSLASLPQREEPLELHIRRLDGGQMTGWLHESVAEGDRVAIEGPVGDCFYTADDPERKLLLVGTGCGLAPLWGIVRDALDRGHRGPIHLFHGSYTPDGLYLVSELRALAEQHANFHYTPCVDDGDPAVFALGRVGDIALATHADLKGWRVYLCGHMAMVTALKKQAFLAGASLGDIHADPIICQPAAQPPLEPAAQAALT